MKIIKLYGPLGEKFGKEFKLDVNTPMQAIVALCHLVKGFQQYIITNIDERYKILVNEIPRTKDELNLECPLDSTFSFVPAIKGSDSDFLMIGLGIALIALGQVEAVSLIMDGLASKIIIGMGTSLLLGGISGLLFDPPKLENQERPENKPNYLFSGAVNTSNQNNPVPLCYGELIVGSQVVSFGIRSEEQVLGNA